MWTLAQWNKITKHKLRKIRELGKKSGIFETFLTLPRLKLSESLFYPRSFCFVNKLTRWILTLTPSLFTLKPSLLCCFHPLSTASPCSSPPYLLFPLDKLKNTPKDKEWVGVLRMLRLQFASGTNSMLATSLKSLRFHWSFPCCPHKRNQRPELVDLPRAFSPPPDPTPGWLPGPPHKQTVEDWQRYSLR